MMFKVLSTVFKTESELDYIQGICIYCKGECHKEAYAHSECVQKDIRKINLELRKKEKLVMK